MEETGRDRECPAEAPAPGAADRTARIPAGRTADAAPVAGSAVPSVRARLSELAAAHPLATLLGTAALLRLLAAVFARGYMASDDHHQVVEIAARWLRGIPMFLDGQEVFYRSLLYPAVHWLILRAARAVGVVDPDAAMLTVRLCLGLYSLWGVAIAWKYGQVLGRRAARRAGWLGSTEAGNDAGNGVGNEVRNGVGNGVGNEVGNGVGNGVGLLAGALVAAHAILPYASVRSLVETAALPPLLHGLYLLDRAILGPVAEPGARRRRAADGLISGLLFGLAILLRTQAVFAAAGAAACLLWSRRFRAGAIWAAGLAAVILLQGLADLALYDSFLASPLAYLRFNRAHLHEYVTGPWWRTVLLVPAAFLPPFGLFFFAAMFRAARHGGVLTWATAVFLIAHAAIPQKQERFLLPIFPELALLGTLGLVLWVRARRQGAQPSPARARWYRRGWAVFWGMNLLLLPLGLIHYGQRARIEPLLEIYRRGDAGAVVADLTEEAPGLPFFYLDGGDPGRSVPVHLIRNPEEMARARAGLAALGPEADRPVYVVIFTAARLPEHLERLQSDLGPVRILRHFAPGPVDRGLRRLNPRHNKSKESWLGVLTIDPPG